MFGDQDLISFGTLQKPKIFCCWPSKKAIWVWAGIRNQKIKGALHTRCQGQVKSQISCRLIGLAATAQGIVSSSKHRKCCSLREWLLEGLRNQEPPLQPDRSDLLAFFIPWTPQTGLAMGFHCHLSLEYYLSDIRPSDNDNPKHSCICITRCCWCPSAICWCS